MTSSHKVLLKKIMKKRKNDLCMKVLLEKRKFRKKVNVVNNLKSSKSLVVRISFKVSLDSVK